MAETVVETKVETSLGIPWNVVVHDDPVNLMSYVTMVFQRVFGFSKAQGATSHVGGPSQRALDRLDRRT